MKKEARPDYSRYKEAMEYLKGHDYVEAGKRFSELADSGYPKAMYQLARLYQGGKGVARDLEEAVDWLKHATNRGYAPAQYRLAACYADGIGVERNIEVAIALYEKAMKSGMAEAAMSLAHYIESHPDKSARDMDRVSNAYATAMKLFKRSNDKQGEDAARKSLQHVCPHHPDLA
jgi:TPR repeat protein